MCSWIKKLLGIKEKEVNPKEDDVVFIPEEKEEKEEKKEERKSPPWYIAGLKWKGKKETDKELEKHLVPLWKRFGLSIKTLSGSLAAWCGLAAASTLIAVGLNYPGKGFRAVEWDNFGVPVQYQLYGIPQGAFVRISSEGNCKLHNGHISQANGDCRAEDIVSVEMVKDSKGVYQPKYSWKKNATIDLYGGNQGDTWKNSTYKVEKICAVRWPADGGPVPKITKTLNCTSGSSGSESTR